MTIRMFTRTLVFSLALLLTSCLKEDTQGITQIETPPTLENLIETLNPLERFYFSPADLAELEAIIQSQYTDLETRSGGYVEIPAGSTDALAAALEEVGEGGTILLKTGEHIESSTVEIHEHVKIIGESNAVLKTHTKTVAQVGKIQPALHLIDVTGVVIKGITFTNQDPLGGTAILLENAPKTRVGNNEFTAYEIGVMVEKSDRVVVLSNTFETSPGWTMGPGRPGYGIIVINGKHARLINNKVSSSLFGIWACDAAGWSLRNLTQQNYVGQILCKVPVAFPLPSGEVIGSSFSANNWLTLFNNSKENLNAGYLVIDGANRNLLSSNFASNNGTYDIELVGDSERFGFFTPTSAANYVYTSTKHSVKDCGDMNTVRGGTLVDTEEDPCF